MKHPEVLIADLNREKFYIQPRLTSYISEHSHWVMSQSLLNSHTTTSLLHSR